MATVAPRTHEGCGTSDRANFNSNLIDIFQSEYNRVDHLSDQAGGTATTDPLRDTLEKRVVQWKFDQLDSDGDSALHRSEVQDLRRMARRIVRPRGCARTFAKFCDLDQDRRISRSEWAVCVGVDINKSRDQDNQQRARTTFTKKQLQVLQANFNVNWKPNSLDMERMAQITGLNKRVIQVWFQNSRAKLRKYMSNQARKANANREV